MTFHTLHRELNALLAVVISALDRKQERAVFSLSRSLIRRSANDEVCRTLSQSMLRPSAQRQQYGYLIFRSQSRRQFSRLVVIDEYLYVRANGILFVDDAKSKSRIPPVQLAKQLLERRAAGF